MLKIPTSKEQSQGNKKTLNDKLYYWYPKHKAWGKHKPEDCKGVGFKRDDENKKEKKNTKQV